MHIFKSRYSLLFSFISLFVLLSFFIRTGLFIYSWHKSGLTLSNIPIIFAKGFIYDLSVAIFFCLAYSIYLLLIPERLNRSLINRIITYTFFSIILFIVIFSLFAEIAFWEEFESRFNFIAVDYLVYTYEVVNNINQSYPLHYLIGGMILATTALMLLLRVSNVFTYTFESITNFRIRLIITGTLLGVGLLAGISLNNEFAEHHSNHYADELSKSGIFSFFAAFKNNELDYSQFYMGTNEKNVFTTVRKDLSEPGCEFISDGYTIRRNIHSSEVPHDPDVIMITLESFSADFMKYFGNTQKLTPTLDSIADHSILFTNMYATGTRTVRGMEALSMSIPPTPGNSIVRRQHNANLYCIGSVFKENGYSRTFFYGGDGYFDNMNNFFGNNGFDIVDRGHRYDPGEYFTGTRTTIADEDVHFENAWGICDEDLYDAVIKQADISYEKKQKFYDFVMTTSNHRPYTYPTNAVDITPGSGREGAVKYTDYAINKFLQKAKTKPWFKNTVIIFVADHCASAAGKNEINVSHYHIPCMIFNLNDSSFNINKQCSQIDLYPTLFGLLKWNYRSNFYGKDVLNPTYSPRAFVGTYQQLGYLVNDTLAVLSPGKKYKQYIIDKKTSEQKPVEPNKQLIEKSISYYQSAYYLFKNKGLKENNIVK